MNRVMLPALALIVSGLMAGALYAGDAEKEAANKFLASQEAINESILGTQKLKIRMMGHDVGLMTLDIQEGTFEEKPCYVLSMRGNIDIGVKTVIEGKSQLAPNLSLLHSESSETEDGELSKHSLYTLKDGVITVVIKQPLEEDESKQERSFEIKQQDGLIVASAEMLVSTLLPREKGKKYEFLRWDDTADKTYPMTVEAVGDDDYNNQTVFQFIEHDKKFNEDELGNVSSTDVESKLWFFEHQLKRMDSADGFSLETNEAPTLTPITREMIDKRDNDKFVVAGFFLGANEKDEDLLKSVLNEFRIVRDGLDVNPDTKGMTNEEKDQIAEMYAGTVIQNVMGGGDEEKTDQEKSREKFVIKMLLKAENFVSEVKNEKQTVRFTDEAAKMFGKLLFVLDKDADGKWEIVGIDEVPEEEEDDAGDTPPEKKDDDGKKEEEDGF